MNEDNMNDPAWDCIRNGKRVLDVFRTKNLPADYGRLMSGSPL